MNDPSNVRRIPAQEQRSMSLSEATRTMGDALGQAIHGQDWAEVKASQRRKAAMQARRDKVTTTLGYVLALSLMGLLVVSCWALMVLIIRVVTP